MKLEKANVGEDEEVGDLSQIASLMPRNREQLKRPQL